MQQRGSLKISSQTKSVSIPLKDESGNVYGWEAGISVAREIVSVENPSPEEIKALMLAVTPGDKRAIHLHLEILSQIKPIGRSELKQASVISYLVFDLHEKQVSEFVVAELCREHRRNPDHVFFPDHAKFLKAAVDRMQRYVDALSESINPKPKPTPTPKPKIAEARNPDPAPYPWEGKKYSAWDESARAAFLGHTQGWNPEILSHILRVYEITPEEYKTALDNFRNDKAE